MTPDALPRERSNNEPNGPAGPSRWFGAAALVPLVGLLGVSGSVLFVEWRGLENEQRRDRLGRIIGYANITPKVSYAQKPDNWIHDEGGETWLWSGWTDGVGHGWFRARRGEIDTSQLSEPIGRDVIQAVDVPLVERGDGPRWQRIAGEIPVLAFDGEAGATAYPLLVLQKVWQVNDDVAGRPVLVSYRPSESAEGVVEAFRPVVDGERLRFGNSGYMLAGRPLLYDVATESLWRAGERGLEAVGGRYRGVVLPRVEPPRRMSWGDWAARNPRGRLIAGSERPVGPAPAAP
jgi:hypothetical protein